MIEYMKYHNIWSFLILLDHIINHDIVNYIHKTESKKSYARAVKLHAPPVSQSSEIMALIGPFLALVTSLRADRR